jgi:hypothetical protein
MQGESEVCARTLLTPGMVITCMDRDFIAFAGVLLSVVFLFASGHMAWFIPMIVSAMYGGWRLGRRIIPADAGA